MKLIMMRGIAASGKSTRAKEIQEAGGDSVRVNRDLLREMLHFGKWSGKNEGFIVDIEKEIARKAIKAGKNVIVDDTNITPRHAHIWRDLALECAVNFEIIQMTTPWQECVKRDAVRPAWVGSHVVIGMALSLGLVEPKKGFILHDIDGTLCTLDHRLHHVKKDPKDWDSFFKEIYKDEPRLDIIEKMKAYSREGYIVILVSGRPERTRVETLKWLLRHGINEGENYLTLLMRKDHDKRPDTDTKLEILNKHFPDRSKIALVVDDRMSVIRMWKEQGLKVEEVGSGEEY